MLRAVPVIFSLFSGLILFSQNFETINPNNIEIVRDEWGVPHIYGKSDADAAYGLAWANCEDAFELVQEMYSVTKPINGRNKGVEGAKVDFFTHFIQTDNIVEREMKNLPKDFLKYLDGYAQGISMYAKTHPKQVKVKGLFPLTNKELLKLYVIVMSSFTRVPDDLGIAYNGELANEKIGLGSNAIAVNKNKTADGKTYLLINPHMPVHGRFSFYEAHLNSEEGLNIHGTLFMGGTSIFMGSNNNLGWGMTFNHFDRGDIYKLKMHPEKKNKYLYDDEWKDLEVKKTKLKVKFGFLRIPVKKETYWSELGPVIKQKKSDNYFAIKTPAIFETRGAYQWYKMNKANSFKEFKTAVDMQAICMFNIVYADKTGNVYFLSNGNAPYRKDSLVDLPYIPGHSSKYVWQRLHTNEELPHNLNPASGFVFNTNNTPYHSTDAVDTLARDSSKKYLDIYPGNNNRADRVLELMAEKEKIDFDYFQKIKFDVTLSKNSYIVKQLQPLLSANPSDHPEIQDMLELMKAWDYVVDSNDIGATLFIASVSEMFEAKGYKGGDQFTYGFDVSKEVMIASTLKAKEWLLKYHGTIKVPLKKIFRAKKGDKEVTPPGFPNVLSANYGIKKKGYYELFYGDAYTQFVKFGDNGIEEMRTAMPFGNSNNPGDKSYFDQAELFRTQKTKVMTLDKQTIYTKGVKKYHPK